MRCVPIVALLLTVASLGACASSESNDVGGAESAVTADPRADLAKKADRIELVEGQSTKILGAPKKIADVFKAMDGRITSLPPGTRPRCPTRFSIVMFDRGGEKIAQADQCGAEAAVLTIGSKVFEVPASETKLREISEREQAVGDILYGITKVVGSDGDTATAEDELAIFLAPLDRDQVPEARDSQPRCMPTATLTYFRGFGEVAKLNIYCSSPNAQTSDAMLIVGEKKTWVTYDPGRIDLGNLGL